MRAKLETYKKHYKEMPKIGKIILCTMSFLTYGAGLLILILTFIAPNLLFKPEVINTGRQYFDGFALCILMFLCGLKITEIMLR